MSNSDRIPKQVSPPAGCKVIHMGLDPLFARYGIRNFPCDLAMRGDPAISLPMLAEALGSRRSKDTAAARAEIDAIYDRVRDQRPIHPAALSRAIDRIIGDGILINELGVQIDHVNLTEPGSYFQQSSAGGLGWGLGAALGAKLAAPDRFVIAAVGDGSYMFGNPTPGPFHLPGLRSADPLCRDQQ
jgi:acetolactate synthase I/II/III large subunit